MPHRWNAFDRNKRREADAPDLAALSCAYQELQNLPR